MKFTTPFDEIDFVAPPNADRMTEDEFADFCMQNQELNLERDSDGTIIFMAPVSSEGGMSESDLNAEVTIWNRRSQLGYVFSSSAGFTLPNGAVRSPDVSWIEKSRWDRLPQEKKQKFAHICPDFVVELRSKSDRVGRLQDKMQEYLENGCRLGFLIDPPEQQAWIYKPGEAPELITDFKQNLSGGTILPDFKLKLSLFVISS